MSAFFTPREIVSELDRYIVGQHDAKRAVAIALRNAGGASNCPKPCARSAAQEHSDDRPDRGCKTEISRRLAKLAQALS